VGSLVTRSDRKKASKENGFGWWVTSMVVSVGRLAGGNSLSKKRWWIDTVLIILMFFAFSALMIYMRGLPQ
jgi:hypothetical protein